MNKRKDISPITSPEFKQKEKSARSQSPLTKINSSELDTTTMSDSGEKEMVESQSSNDISRQILDQTQKGKATYAESVHSHAGSWDKGTTNMVNVEIIGLNGNAFKGTFNRSDGFELYEAALKLDLDKLWGLSIWYQGSPRVRFKLKEAIHLESTFQKEDFMYERKRDNQTDFINGRIIGFKKAPEATSEKTPFDPIGSIVRVNLYGCSYNFKREQVEEWIHHFGDQVSAQEEIMDRDRPTFGTGDLSVRVKLRKHIPQFLPMFGKRIRVAYRGMTSLCSNCFEPGHFRSDCAAEKVMFVQYVKVFRREAKLPEHCFGSWIRILENMEKYGNGGRSSEKIRASNETNLMSIEEETGHAEGIGQTDQDSCN